MQEPMQPWVVDIDACPVWSVIFTRWGKIGLIVAELQTHLSRSEYV